MASWTRSTWARPAASSHSHLASSPASGQRGIGLLLALAVLIIVGGSLLAAVLSAAQMQRERERATTEALAAAKRALIAYAAAFAEMTAPSVSGELYVPGSLPCPEVAPPSTAAEEGRSWAPTNSPCGTSTTSLLGRLPWRELRIDPPRDGSGQCLWYAVSSTFKNRKFTSIGQVGMLNWDTPGLFDIVQADPSSGAPVYIAGPDPSKRAVAVVLAPGAPLAGKSPVPHPNAPQCRGSYVASDYLDSVDGVDNAAAPGATASFVVAEQTSTFNDRLVYVTAQDVFAEVERQQSFKMRIREMMRHAADCVAGFARYHQSATPGDKRLPWAMPLALASVAAYSSYINYRDGVGQMSGRLPKDVRRSCDAVRGFSCPALERPLVGAGNTPEPSSIYCSPLLWNARDDWWYQNWKDQLFYAIAFNHRPDANSTTGPCPTCLKANGGGKYAAMLLFAGRSVSGQQRATVAEKSAISNYFEGRNASNHPNLSGDGDYQAGPSSATFNDILVCIDDQLNVIDPCPSGS
jgi:type II secretory pathway pseudopilin PulG